MAALSPLIGRAEELGLVEKLVQEHRLVTVTGAAGVGKTRLVEELAPSWPPRATGSSRCASTTSRPARGPKRSPARRA